MKFNFEKSCRTQNFANPYDKDILKQLLVFTRQLLWSRNSDLIDNGVQVPHSTMKFIYFRTCGLWTTQVTKHELLLKKLNRLRYLFIYLFIYLSYLKWHI